MNVERMMIVRHIMRLGAYMEREGGRLLFPLGLTHQQFLALSRISEQGPLCQKDLCDKLLYEKSNISRIIKKLLGLEFVTVIPDPGDARKQVLTITESGQTTVQNGRKIISDWTDNWLTLLTDSEGKQFLSSLSWLNTLAR